MGYKKRNISIFRRGFTIVEVLIVVPIVILVIGTFTTLLQKYTALLHFQTTCANNY